MPENNNGKMDDFLKGQGLMAEMALLFLRSALRAGATKEEATLLVQAYISAVMSTAKKEKGGST